MDPLAEAERRPDEGVAARARERPTGARMAEPGEARRPPLRGRVAFSLALVALALLASLAAWQGFVHSPWGARLGALNEIVFVGGQAADGASGVLGDTTFSVSPQVYVARPDGSGLRRLTNQADGSYFSPVWSPDG